MHSQRKLEHIRVNLEENVQFPGAKYYDVDEIRSQGDPRSIEAIALFTAWLGGFCGDIALIAGATGGVYLAGGVLPRWGDLFDTALFHARFIAKGAHRPIMEAIPIQLVIDKQAAFRGLIALEEQAA